MANPKTVYLIRHAESLENHRLACLSRSFKSIGRFSLPDGKDAKTGVEFLNLPAQVDTDVSERGRRQIETMGAKLKEDDFVTNRGVELVVHSPLLRARQTSKGMLGCGADDGEETQRPAAEGAVAAAAEPRAIQLPCLAEKTPTEWIPGNSASFKSRILEFESWLSKQEEEVVAVVGHSQYFKAMLGLPFKFGNCDVWRVGFDPEGLGRGESSVSEGSTEEKKDDTTADNAASVYVGAPLIEELPRGWSSLQNVYRCEV